MIGGYFVVYPHWTKEGVVYKSLEKQECNHEYLPDGGKYSPQWQMKCIHCGKVIND